MNKKLINKAIGKAAFGLFQISVGNIKSAIACFQSAIKALQQVK